jgi:hypothetical protein
MTSRGRPFQRFLVLLTCALLVACDRAGQPPTAIGAPPPDIAAYVVGEAAAALTPGGTFPYAGPTQDRGEAIISPDRAGELAIAYVRAFGQFFIQGWERDAGRDIHLPSLSVHPRVFYAESPYGRFPEGPFQPAYRKGFGPYYLVTLTDGRSPVLLIGVSAFNTDIRIDERGLVVKPPVSGNEFVSIGVSSDTLAYTLLTPERAVERVARRTGARVSQPPRLLHMSAFHHPAIAVWRLSLDRPVRVRGVADGKEKVVPELFVNGLNQYLVPADEQPRGFSDDFLIGPPWDPTDRKTLRATVPVSPGGIVEWVQVVPAQESVVQNGGAP